MKKCAKCRDRNAVILGDKCFVCTPLSEKETIKKRWSALTPKEKEACRKAHRTNT